MPEALNHGRSDRKAKFAHEARLKRGSLIAQIAGGKAFEVNSSPQQAVARIAKALCATAVSKAGEFEAMELAPGGAERALPYFLAVRPGTVVTGISGTLKTV